MSFLQLHRDKEHKFKNGHWTWGEHESKLKFHSHDDKKTKNSSVDAGAKFKKNIDVAEEKIFREKFQRSSAFYDSKVVTLQDIKNLVLFTMNSRAAPRLIEFLHCWVFDKFLHGLIFYVDLYLLVLEYLMIRRDKELKGEIRDSYSIKVEQFLSKQLSDRRLRVAREYSKVCRHSKSDTFEVTVQILFRSHSCATRNRRARENSCRDRQARRFCIFSNRWLISRFNALLFRCIDGRLMRFVSVYFTFGIECLAFATRQFFTIFTIFLSLASLGFPRIVACELNRLFRTEFFNLARKKNCLYQFSFRERQVRIRLY